MPEGEDTLYTNVTRHLAYGETFFVTMTRNANYIATEILNTLFVTLLDAVRNCDSITALEFGVLFLF